MFGINISKISIFFIKLGNLDNDYPIEGFKKTQRWSYILNIIIYSLLFFLLFKILQKLFIIVIKKKKIKK